MKRKTLTGRGKKRKSIEPGYLYHQKKRKKKLRELYLAVSRRGPWKRDNRPGKGKKKRRNRSNVTQFWGGGRREKTPRCSLLCSFTIVEKKKKS